MKDNHRVPLSNLLASYALKKTRNRHAMKVITDRVAARDEVYMYKNIYGGTQLDNGEFGTAFIRGLVLYFQRDFEVNTAKYAADLAKKRLSNQVVITQKLTPPCHREQISRAISCHLWATPYCHRPTPYRLRTTAGPFISALF